MAFKRGLGKKNNDIKQYYWYSYYLKNTVYKKKLSRKVHAAFLKELFDTFVDMMIFETFELKLPGIGKFRIRSKKTIITTKTGEIIIRKRIDWKSTWEMWRNKYPGLTDDEIIKNYKHTKQLKIINFEKDELCEFIWDNQSSSLMNKGFYKFSVTRLAKKKLVDALNDPNRKVFYYG